MPLRWRLTLVSFGLLVILLTALGAFVSITEEQTLFTNQALTLRQEVRLASGPAGDVGAVYSQRMAGPGGRSIDGDYQISVAETGVRLGFFVVAGPARPAGSFALTEHDAGTTVSFSLTLEPKGLMKLMGPMITKTMQAEVAQLENLKRVLEVES